MASIAQSYDSNWLLALARRRIGFLELQLSDTEGAATFSFGYDEFVTCDVPVRAGAIPG